MDKISKLSKQLLKSILIIYFIITASVTIVHLVVDYYYTKAHIKDELQSMAKTFTPAIQTALWDLNSEQLKSIADGMKKIPLIFSVIINDSNGNELVKSEKNFMKTDELSYSYKIYQKYNDKNIFLAEVFIYSDNSVIIDRLKVGFGMIFLNAFIKSTALVFLFILSFRKYLERPLGDLTSKISHLDWKNKRKRKIDITFENQNELYVLQKIFNELLENISTEEENRVNFIEKMNIKLENDVNTRTQELKDANDKLQKLANTDTLTQLNNRSKIDDEIRNKYEVFKLNGKVFSLIMMDIDFFKQVNDEFGHQIGDYVLKEIAVILKNLTRGLDIVGRWGGEEFMIICTDTTIDGAYLLAENLRKAIQDHTFKDVGKKSASFGVAQIKDNITIDKLIQNVDKALYLAKNNGRNQCVKSNQLVL